MSEERKLTDADIEALVKRLGEAGHIPCRFQHVDPTVMEEAVRFYKNYNRVFTEAKGTFLKTLVVLLVSGGAGLLVFAIWAKIKMTALGIPTEP